MPSSAEPLLVNDRFFTTNVGGTLILKACGFIQDHQARIVHVDEDRLKIRIGQSWITRLLFHCSKEKPAEISLTIHRDAQEALDEAERMQLPARSCSQIDVTISPQSRSWQQDEFQQFARRILWSLRAHFVAP